MENDFESLYNNKKIQQILDRACYKYKNVLDYEELNDCKTDALWKCFQKYDESKGNTLKNSLFRYVIWQCKNKMRGKFKKGVKLSSIGERDFGELNSSINNLDLMDSIDKLESSQKKVIMQFFFEKRNLLGLEIIFC